MLIVECAVFTAQTGIIADRPASVSTFHEYYIARENLPRLKELAGKSPDLSSEDLMWLDRNNVSESRARFSIIGERQTSN